MKKSLYEEALVDAKKLREVAEDNAKRALIEAVTPRIRDLIERELMSEDVGNSDPFMDETGVEPLDVSVETEETQEEKPASVVPPTPPLKNAQPVKSVRAAVVDGPGPVDVVAVTGDTSGKAISTPDEQGKVTLDVDALEVPGEEEVLVDDVDSDDDEEFEMSLESFDALSSIKKAASTKLLVSEKKFMDNVKLMQLIVAKYKKLPANKIITKESQQKISHMISRIENMYAYVQEQLVDSSNKEVFEERLETNFKDLNKLQEQKTMKKNKRLTEEDVTLKLTNLPDDIDLDNVGVDLITDEDGEEGGDEGHDDGEELDLSDLGGDDEGGNEEEDLDMEEGDGMDDDTVVEIDENMLRKEIKRMKALREDAKPWHVGNGPDASMAHSFGDGKEEEEAFEDGEVTTESEELEEGEMDEADELTQRQNRRKGEEYGHDVADGHETPKMEAVKRARFEKRLQERAQRRAAQLKREARTARGSRLASIKQSYARVVRQFNESVARSAKTNQNGKSKQHADGADQKLRAKLAETNLFNAKLLYTNKLLQSESLSKRQKAEIIEALDSANSVREAKLVYESLTKTLSNKPNSLRENTSRVLGSSSRATGSGSSKVVSEGYETDRWARLAGLNRNKKH